MEMASVGTSEAPNPRLRAQGPRTLGERPRAICRTRLTTVMPTAPGVLPYRHLGPFGMLDDLLYGGWRRCRVEKDPT